MVRSRTAVKFIIAASKDIASLPERGCITTRREAIGRLQRVKGPFLVLLGYRGPCSGRARHLGSTLRRGCTTPICPIGYRRLGRSSVCRVVHRMLCRFPIARVRFCVPG